jgi:DNA-binding transcriptional MerR regulator
MELTVSQVSRIANISVRALHHYDEIGLLVPSGRSDAGYRLYSHADLARLQQILFFRALELPLGEIARIMTDPDFDVAATLRYQRELLIEKVARSHALIRAVEAAIANLETQATKATQKKGDPTMNDDEGMNPSAGEGLFDAWKDFKQEDYEAEAEQRWGDTEAFKESKRRTARYTKQDWELIKREAAAVMQGLCDQMIAGTAPDAPAAMDAAEAHRAHVTRWFYPCSPAIHRGLGDLYVNDPRFTANIDKLRAGLAVYARAAFAANADRQQNG